MRKTSGLFRRALQYRSHKSSSRSHRIRITSRPLPFPAHCALSHAEARDIRARQRLLIRVGAASPHRDAEPAAERGGGLLPALMLAVSVVAGFAAGDAVFEAYQGYGLATRTVEDDFFASTRRNLEQELWERNAAIAAKRRAIDSSDSGEQPGGKAREMTPAEQDRRAELATLIAQRDLAYAVGRRRLLSVRGEPADGLGGSGRSSRATVGSSFAGIVANTRLRQLTDRTVEGYYETVIRRLRRGSIAGAEASLESLGEYLRRQAGRDGFHRRVDVEELVWRQARAPFLRARQTGGTDALGLAVRTASMVELRNTVFRGDRLLHRGRFADAQRAYRRALATLTELRTQTDESFSEPSGNRPVDRSGTGPSGERSVVTPVGVVDDAGNRFRADLEARVTWLDRIENERSALRDTIEALRREIGQIEKYLAANVPPPPAATGGGSPDPALSAISAERRRLDRVAARVQAVLDAAVAASVPDTPPSASLGGD